MNRVKSVFSSALLFGIVVLLSTAHGSSYYPPSSGSGGYNRAIKHACKDQVRERIWSDHRYIQKVEFTNDSFRIRRESNAKSRVVGKGRFLNRKQRWKTFDFNCVYSHPQDRITSATYKKISNDWSGGQDWNRPDYDYDGRRACRHEIDRKILRNHESASQIHWNERSVRQWQKSSSETAYRGTGQFIGGRGRTRYFEFQCVYNHRRDDVNNAWINVRD